MGRILVGTSSWTDKSLIECGKFYPREVKTAEDRLRYYASQFSVVQVDSAWYAIPSEGNARLWAQRTPDDFVFDVKLFRLFTRHQTPVIALPPDIRGALPAQAAKKNVVYFEDVPEDLRGELWQRYTSAVRPLHECDKLGVVLLQMAPWVKPGAKSIDHILHCRDELGDLPAAVEFRNASWFEGDQRQQTLDFLADNQLAHVVVDEPTGFQNSVPLVPAVTSHRVAYLRLHGRNRETWNRKDLSSSADRFNYEYAEAELRELVPVARRLAERTQQVHVMFNNNYQDQGQRNARAMARLLFEVPFDSGR